MTARRPIHLVAGNWKMNTTVAEGLDLARAMRAELDGSRVEVELLPPFPHLVGVREVLQGSSLRLGAQD
ncbi:MAG TPA: triose-phosphate isomerase, partial [Chloroflexi bacterium]|nr:triose-phosphate isomerase [Chloroflexota bacterium]